MIIHQKNKNSVDKSTCLLYNINRNILWKRIEVVITGLTRNQVVLTGSWVRIPPLPPARDGGRRIPWGGHLLHGIFLPRSSEKRHKRIGRFSPRRQTPKRWAVICSTVFFCLAVQRNTINVLADSARDDRRRNGGAVICSTVFFCLAVRRNIINASAETVYL